MPKNSKKDTKPQCVQTDVICCDFFKQNIKEYGWFKLDHLGEEQYLMPHILGTKIRINQTQQMRMLLISYFGSLMNR